MFPAPLPSTEPNPQKQPIVDMHDPLETLEMFLQILSSHSSLQWLDTLASVLKLVDKYNVQECSVRRPQELPCVLVLQFSTIASPDSVLLPPFKRHLR
jgi:hypothetical protein